MPRSSTIPPLTFDDVLRSKFAAILSADTLAILRCSGGFKTMKGDRKQFMNLLASLKYLDERLQDDLNSEAASYFRMLLATSLIKACEVK